MKNHFQYSVLRYTHSQALGEVLNLGIIFLFSEEEKLVFLHPTSIDRIKRAYPNVDIDFLMKSIKSVALLTKSVVLTDSSSWNLSDIIHTQILPRDDDSFQFDKTQRVVRYSPNTEKMAKQFYELYFPDDLWK